MPVKPRVQADGPLFARRSRRDILAGAGAMALLPTVARAADALRVGKAIASSFPFAGLELGKEQGIFASENLDITISTFRGDGQLQQAFAAGALDVGVGSGPGMGYASKGVPAHAVASLASEPRNMALVVMNPALKSVDDLKGKRIGVSTAGSLTEWLARAISVRKGWGAEGVEVVPMGETRTRNAAMKAGDLQASVTSTEEGLELQEQGVGRVLMNFGDIVPDFHTHVIFASDALIKQKPDTVKRFLRGWFKTVAFMRDNRAATIKSIAKTMNLSEKVVDMAYDTEMGMMSFDGVFSAKAVEIIRGSLKDLGITDSAPAAAAMYDPGFTPVKL
jgi:ABC-type nitrate/sulfonate/bicarbonate transport system substrate-binding protein